MIDVGLKIVLILILATIFWQDLKDRMVYWFLYFFSGIIFLAIQIYNVGYRLSLINSCINLCFIIIMVLSAWLYATLIKKKTLINESIGIGDLFLFVSLCFTFSAETFVTLFVFSLIFSLLLHQYFKGRSEHQTVPLAGYMSLFFAAVYFTSLFIQPGYLFA
jgi:hypothetical protein